MSVEKTTPNWRMIHRHDPSSWTVLCREGYFNTDGKVFKSKKSSIKCGSCGNIWRGAGKYVGELVDEPYLYVDIPRPPAPKVPYPII